MLWIASVRVREGRRRRIRFRVSPVKMSVWRSITSLGKALPMTESMPSSSNQAAPSRLIYLYALDQYVNFLKEVSAWSNAQAVAFIFLFGRRCPTKLGVGRD